MKLLPANPLLPDRSAGVAAMLRVEKIDFAEEILPIRDAFYAAYLSILRCMSMMEDMQLIPSAVHGYWEQHGHHYKLLGTPERPFIQ